MKAIIGTAGHVDHGKTALIKALTGITTARPHEQARGMTLDLGFAHFDDGQGNGIGVVDVPGHERFIRNMVAGVWSLDLLLLVIAADEGWMPMTSSHLKVAHAMGVRDVIVCINKADAVDETMLEMVEEEALERCMEITDEIPDSICVSALKGTHIDKLRGLIISHLARQEKTNNGYGSHLYLDRIFTVNGIGTVVTGSLVGDAIKVGDKLKMLPAGKEVQVRSLQSYHCNLDQAEPVSRVAVGLKGIAKKELARGHCLVARNSRAMVTEQLLVRLDSEATDHKRIREVELALGTYHGLARFIPIKGTRLARLKLSAPLCCFWGQRMALIRHGGSELIHSAQVVWQGDIALNKRKALHKLLDALPEVLDGNAQMRLHLDLHGYAPEDLLVDNSLATDAAYIKLGGWIMSRSCYDDMAERAIELLDSEKIALSLSELSTRLNVNSDVLDLRLQALKEEGKIRFSQDAWMLGGGASESDLGDAGQKLLNLIRSAGLAGFEADKVKIPGAQKELRNLVRLGFVIALEGRIYYTSELYHELLVLILSGFSIGDSFGIALARERTSLSRKYMIPLLNRMERDGWVRREDNDRVILKLPEIASHAA